MQNEELFEELVARLGAAKRRRVLTEEELARLERNRSLLGPAQLLLLRNERARLERSTRLPGSVCACVCLVCLRVC